MAYFFAAAGTPQGHDNRDTPGAGRGWHKTSHNLPLFGRRRGTGRVHRPRTADGDVTPGSDDGRWRGPTPERVGEAAALLYRDAETDEAIARRLGIARRTLARWKGRPEFAAAWAALRAYHRAELLARWREAPPRR